MKYTKFTFSILFLIGVLSMASISYAAAVYPPRGITVKQQNNAFLLSWKKPLKSNNTGFRVYRSETKRKIGNMLQELDKNTFSFLDLQVLPNIHYYYTVHSIGRQGKESQNTIQIPVILKSIATTLSGPISDFEYSNNSITMKCISCYESQKPIVEESFRLQTKAYECIAGVFGYKPGINQQTNKPRITYVFSNRDQPQDFDAENVGYTHPALEKGNAEVISPGFFGFIKKGNRAVNSIDDVQMDLHETTHAFTDSAMNFEQIDFPRWLNEGFAMLNESEIKCDPKQPYFHEPHTRHWMGKEDWKSLKKGLPLMFNNPLDAYQKGNIFFGALEDDYHCETDCEVKIWNSLRVQSQDDPTKKYRLLRIEGIKAAIEEVVGANLDYLFRTAQLNSRE